MDQFSVLTVISVMEICFVVNSGNKLIRLLDSLITCTDRVNVLGGRSLIPSVTACLCNEDLAVKKCIVYFETSARPQLFQAE